MGGGVASPAPAEAVNGSNKDGAATGGAGPGIPSESVPLLRLNEANCYSLAI